MANESKFKRQLIKEIEEMFPGAFVLKTNANQIQGIPDQLILYGPNWAMIEAKDTVESHRQPNQNYYVNLFNQMSYASFVYPQNKEVVLDELQHTLRSTGSSRFPIRK